MSDDRKNSKKSPASKSNSKTKVTASTTKKEKKKDSPRTTPSPSPSPLNVSSPIIISSQPCTSAHSDILTRKSSKNKISDDNANDQPLDLSFKRQRIQSDPLQTSFYEFRPITNRARKSGGETNFKGSIITPFFRVPQSERPWGTLYFYENQKFVLCYDLYNYQPIKITGQSILGLRESQDNEKNAAINYNDWQHVIGKT